MTLVTVRGALSLLVLVWLLAVSAAAAGAEEAPEVTLARSFNAAWSAHDLDRVMSFFAEDAVLKQPAASITLQSHDGQADDGFGTGKLFQSTPLPEDRDGNVLWAAGKTELRAWVRDLLSRNYRCQTANYRGAGDTVRWDFRVSLDPYQLVRGTDPTEGTAKAVVRAGKIVSLLIADDPESMRRRSEQIMRAAAARNVALPAHMSASGPTAQSGPGNRPSAAVRASSESSGYAWPLALFGLATGSYVVAARRQRRHRHHVILVGPAR